MVRLAFRRKLTLLVLAVALSTPWPVQARPRESPSAEPLTGFVARLTEWIAIWFGDVGCSLDPNGRCRDTPGSQPPASSGQLDVGCSMDPSGTCGDHG